MRWTPEQDRALRAASEWLADPDGPQVFKLFGYAGTGKSTLARHLAQDLEVLYMAYTGKAAQVMRRMGCQGASTIHSAIYKIKNPESPNPEFELDPDSDVLAADLVLADEMSMLGPDVGQDLLSFGTKVLVLGDPAQLPPVGDDAGFFSAGKPDVMLTEIHRQAADNPIIRMSMDVREGRPLVLGRWGESKVIRRSEVERQDVLEADQVLVGRNRTRQSFNARVRELRFDDVTPWPQTGERLICLRNNRQLGVLNGSLWDVRQSTPAGDGWSKLELEPDFGGERVTAKVHPAFFKGQEGDLEWEERRQSHEFTYGYAITVHKAQGSQWDDVYLFDESQVFRQNARAWLYTGLTRAAKRITVVV